MAYYDTANAINTYLKAAAGVGAKDPGAAATEANIADAPNIDKISEIVNRINQQRQQEANLSRTGGSATLDQQMLENIDRMAQGLPSAATVSEAQAAAAQQWGGRGFATDTPAWGSAVRRALGLTSEQLQQQGMADYSSYLASHPSAPIWGAENALSTPAIYAQRQESEADRALKSAQFLEQAREFDASLAQKRGSDLASLYAKIAPDIVPSYFNTSMVSPTMQQVRAAQDEARAQAGANIGTVLQAFNQASSPYLSNYQYGVYRG